MRNMLSSIVVAAVVLFCGVEVFSHTAPHCTNPMLIHYARPNFRCFFLHGQGNGLGKVIEDCHKNMEAELRAATEAFVNLDETIQTCSGGDAVPRIRQSTLMGVPSSGASSGGAVTPEDVEAYDNCLEEGSAILFFLLEDLKKCDNVQSCGDAPIDAALSEIQAAGRDVQTAFEECVEQAARK